MAEPLRHISLFSGMGGFDLAAEWMGWQNIAHCEWNEFGRKILNHYWPQAASHEDITKTDFTVYRGQCDIITGGFPCQPFSHAGKRAGTTDVRYLWPEMLRAITEARPRYVIGENVTGICSMVFPARASKVESEATIYGQNHHRTMEADSVLHRIIRDFERIGYDCQPLIIPAAAVNAPHRRDRIWLIATNTESGRHGRVRNTCQEARPCQSCKPSGSCCGIPSGERPTTNTDGTKPRTANAGADKQTQSTLRGHQACHVSGTLCSAGAAADTNGTGWREEQQLTKKPSKQGRQHSEKSFTDGPEYWQGFPSESPVCSGNDGLPTKLDHITVPKWRKESLKAAGNAIVPQVAFEIFKAIQQLENELNP